MRTTFNLSFVSEIRHTYFRKGTHTRALVRIWDQRHKMAEHIDDLSIGRSGGLFKKAHRKQCQKFAKSLSIGVRRTIDKDGWNKTEVQRKTVESEARVQ